MASFSAVGPFQPLNTDRAGQVVREVAAAQFRLLQPAHPTEPVPLWVALVRDRPRTGERAGAAGPAPPLVPIVSTLPCADARALAQLYQARWAAQENIIRDWLRPLGLDVNHGYARHPVPNSEVAKRRARLERQQQRALRRAQAARERAERAAQRVPHLRLALATRQAALAQRRQRRQRQGLAQGGAAALRHAADQEVRTAAEQELAQRRERLRRVEQRQAAAGQQVRRHEQEAAACATALTALAAHERTMYELDDRKDQVMTVCKVALANLGMWVRDHYFPAEYSHATWRRLVPFFQLGGRVVREREQMRVELASFNDRQLNRDLAALCTRVNQRRPRLPDGRILHLSVAGNTNCCGLGCEL